MDQLVVINLITTFLVFVNGLITLTIIAVLLRSLHRRTIENKIAIPLIIGLSNMAAFCITAFLLRITKVVSGPSVSITIWGVFAIFSVLSAFLAFIFYKVELTHTVKKEAERYGTVPK